MTGELNPLYLDPDAYNTGWTQGMLSRLLTDWIGGSPWWLESLTFQMRAMNVPGDSVRLAGRISDRETGHDGVERLTLEVWIANARVGVTTPGTAVVRLALPPVMDGLGSTSGGGSPEPTVALCTAQEAAGS